MAMPFDSEEIAKRGWRQGAILGPTLTGKAGKLAPSAMAVADVDKLVLTSHDCDLLNANIHKEPFAEVLCMRAAAPRQYDKSLASGRNPRMLQLQVCEEVLSCVPYERWPIPRTLLMKESPARHLPDKERRLVTEWLAKRYIRAAFPTTFDQRWRRRLKDWLKLLRKYSKWTQGRVPPSQHARRTSG